MARWYAAPPDDAPGHRGAGAGRAAYPAGMREPALLPVHGVRVLGHASAQEVAGLYGLDADEAEEHLLDAEARGWVRRAAYRPGERWSMTGRGRACGEELLAVELDALGARQQVRAAHRRFLPLNARLGPVMTRWQLRPTPQDPLAANDHLDRGYDARVLREVAALVEELAGVTDDLAAAVPRLGVHQPRARAAASAALAGDHAWVDSPQVASVNLVWIQLHEDLLATLGIPRGQEPAP